MTGWRIGWACGNPQLVKALGKVKANIDSGIFSAIQVAGIAALDGPKTQISQMCSLYQDRRDVLVDGLRNLGWQINSPQATFYIWIRLPKGNNSSIKFASRLLKKANLVVTPGVGFGKSGEGYIRMALTVPVARLKEAIRRIKKIC